VSPTHVGLVVALALALAGCPGSEPPASGTGSAAASASSGNAPAPSQDRRGAILTAEHRRSAAAITEADQQSRDVTIRRAAARALARIGGEAARPGLLRALADEDEDVIAWGAYGLGFSCKGHEKENVSALVTRALARASEPSSALAPRVATSGSASSAGSAASPPAASPRLDAWFALSRAVGRCGAEESEPTLVAWLAGPRERAIAAAYALGDLATAKQKLREETLVALLNIAAGSAASPPVPEALFPVGRLEHVPLTVIERIREVATARLAEAGDSRLFAVRALGRSEGSAAVELKHVLTSPSAFSAAERAEAVKALKRLGKAGQRALADALPGLSPSADPVALTALIGDDFGVLLTAVNALSSPGPARKALTGIATLPLPPSAPAAIARRVSWLRCAAAKVLADDDFSDKLLAACDVTEKPPADAPDAGSERAASSGSIGARAVVEVLGRGEIVGARLAAYRAHALGGELRSREAALELLEGHEEIEGTAAILTRALEAKESGLVATAAEVISKQPQRATDVAAPRKSRKGKRKKADKPEASIATPAPSLIKALLFALSRPAAADDPEMLDAVIDAVGALSLKEARPRLDELCRSPYPTTREHTEKALGLLGGEKKTCAAPPEGGSAPAELQSIAAGAATLAPTLTLETDVGSLTLTLDPILAPVIVTRVVDLARSGYYNGMVVHRVDAGFVTQFGAPFGDGFGGPEGKPAVRCETAPLPFVPLAVGIALSGRDTGSSQLFVMHGRAPHLDGQYALVGTATGPWSSFVDGDVIRRVTASP
jgi:cyclophilin family peptidyl-prolyl cis-trans isomerase/HEAT repeat protein